MNTQEWLKSLTYGSRVRMRTPESLPGEWPVTVIDFNDTEIEVYSEHHRDAASFSRETGKDLATKGDGTLHDWWYLEPLTEEEK